MLHHAFEMLLKAVVYQNTGKIRDSGRDYNYTFCTCVNKLKDPLHLLDENQSIILKTLDGLRDCAMHDVISLSEDALYLHTQSGVTLFDDLLKSQFNQNLTDYLPERVLPISTHPPSSINVFFDNEFSYIQELITPGKRSRIEAISKLRPLVVLEKNIANIEIPTSDYKLNKIISEMKRGTSWKDLFPGVANLKMDSKGSGLTFSLRLTKGEGLPVRRLCEGEDPDKALLFKEINLMDRYPFGAFDINERLSLKNMRTTLSIIDALDIQSQPEYFKAFKIGKVTHKRYSQKALDYIIEKIQDMDLEEARKKYQRNHYSKRIET